MTATTLTAEPFAFDRAVPLRRGGTGAGLALSIKGLGKAFGDKTVLEGLDLDIPAGQFVAVIGRSGCGKSTLRA